MKYSPVDVVLGVEVHGREVVAMLTFLNVSAQPQLLNKINACVDGTIDNDVFVIDCGGTPVDYGRPLRKRMPPSVPEDFVEIAPNQVLRFKVRLDGAYEFPQHDCVCEAVYDAMHGSSSANGLFGTRSNAVKFAFPGKNAVG
jgi:hypothetical protein